MVLISLIVLSYSISFFLALRFFFLTSRQEKYILWARSAFLFAFLLQLAFFLEGILEKSFSLYFFPHTLFFLSLTLSFLFLAFRGVRHLPGLYLILPPLVSFLLLLFVFQPPAQSSLSLPAFVSPAFLLLHIASIMLSYAVFILAFCFSLFYLIKDMLLKKKILPPSFFDFPPLQDLDKLGLRLLLLGFPLLTLGLFLGAFFAQQRRELFPHFDPKVIFSYLLWFFYSTAIVLRISKKCSGKKGAYLVIAGFFFLIFTYMGINLLAVGWHSYP